MTGKDYIATTRLTNRKGDVLALPGESCAKVPDGSLGWLADDGLIVPAPKAGKAKSDKGAR